MSRTRNARLSTLTLGLMACCLLLCLLGGRASAQTANTSYVQYAFYGPPGNYKIELFEVGAPYPSRQDVVSGYTGQFTYRRTWSYISTGTEYFIRVTRSGGPAKQTVEFYVNSGYQNYTAPELNWYDQ